MGGVVNIGEAKTRLSDLVSRAERGEDVFIARDGEPVVRLAPLPRRRPVFGAGAGGTTVIGDRALFTAESDLDAGNDIPVDDPLGW